jgi:hypothetical protein
LQYVWRFILAAAVAAPPASSQPASADQVAAPDLSADTEPLGNPRKFYVFHRPQTTFAEAVHDLSVCLTFANPQLFPKPPLFVPWTEVNAAPKPNGSGPPLAPAYYGLPGVLAQAAVDALISGPIIAGVGRSARQVNMSSCMMPRGYTRYRISEKMWKELNGKDMKQALMMQAKIASGPQPNTPVAP